MKRGLFALVCLVCTAGWLASTAAACHSEVSATIDCSGKVSYTANAWNSSGASTKSRTNPDVRVWASYDNGGSYTQVGSGHFGSDNGFSFAGTFSAGSASSVVVKVQEVARWASGDSPGAAHYVTVAKQGCGSSPPTCPSQGMVKSGGITISGGTATVGFTVAAGCQNIQLSLVSYKAPSATFDEQTADQQQLFDSKTQTFSAGQYSLSVAVPSCYFQIDFVYGTPIAKLGPAGTNNFYGKQGRLIEAMNGGTTSCTTTTTPPPSSTPPPPAPPTPVVAVVLTKLERVGTTGSFVAGPVGGRVGDIVYYELSVRNIGNVMVTVTVSDPGCDSGTLVATSAQGIGPTGTATFTCSHKLTAADGSTFVNTAVATGTAGNGAQATSTSSVTAQVQPAIVVAGASTSVQTKAVVKKAVTKKVVHKHAVKRTKHVKKVTKKAKPARPVVARAHFTG